MPPLFVTTGQFLAARRKSLNLTQTELAARAGVTRQFISAIEGAVGLVHIATLEKLMGPLEATKLLDLVPQHQLTQYHKKINARIARRQRKENQTRQERYWEWR